MGNGCIRVHPWFTQVSSKVSWNDSEVSWVVISVNDGEKIKKTKKNLKKKIILDPNFHTHGGVFGVPDHEFHGPRAVGEAKNRLYGDVCALI